MEFKHKSVLLDETVGGLNIKPDGIYVDGTVIQNILKQYGIVQNHVGRE